MNREIPFPNLDVPTVADLEAALRKKREDRAWKSMVVDMLLDSVYEGANEADKPGILIAKRCKEVTAAVNDILEKYATPVGMVEDIPRTEVAACQREAIDMLDEFNARLKAFMDCYPELRRKHKI